MGWMRHHAIVVTSWSSKALTRAHNRAAETFPSGTVTELSGSVANSYGSFLVAPDGSKEGWDDSEAGDDNRAAFIAWLIEEFRDKCDGSSIVDWVEVQFGDSGGNSRLIRHSDEALFKNTTLDPDEQPIGEPEASIDSDPAAQVDRLIAKSGEVDSCAGCDRLAESLTKVLVMHSDTATELAELRVELAKLRAENARMLGELTEWKTFQLEARVHDGNLELKWTPPDLDRAKEGRP